MPIIIIYPRGRSTVPRDLESEFPEKRAQMDRLGYNPDDPLEVDNEKLAEVFKRTLDNGARVMCAPRDFQFIWLPDKEHHAQET
jgi:hypothetical protein